MRSTPRGASGGGGPRQVDRTRLDLLVHHLRHRFARLDLPLTLLTELVKSCDLADDGHEGARAEVGDARGGAWGGGLSLRLRRAPRARADGRQTGGGGRRQLGTAVAAGAAREQKTAEALADTHLLFVVQALHVVLPQVGALAGVLLCRQALLEFLQVGVVRHVQQRRVKPFAAKLSRYVFVWLGR
jgi:hypothetical protein